MANFPDVTIRENRLNCLVCGKLFKNGEALTEIQIIAGIEDNYLIHVSGTVEYGHSRCVTGNEEKAVAYSHLLKPTKETARAVMAKTPSHICKFCKKTLNREDRIIIAFTIEGSAIDPVTKMPGLLCSQDFESAHVRCNDPKLTLGSYLEIKS